MKVRCPHCHNGIELVDAAPLVDIECPSCGSHFSLISGKSTTDAYGSAGQQTIAHFRLIRMLGTGAFGCVWLAHDQQLDCQVAIKIPRLEQLDASQAEHFFREARAAAQLRHANIVHVREAGRDGDSLYIASDYIAGANLKEWLSGQRLSFRESAELVAKLADALEHAHGQGVVHRDLKPGNILLEPSGEPHVTDFGLAKRDSGEITMTLDGQILGTPAYMSPEQAAGRGHYADARTDIYSLGVVLFELLTGELPFRGERNMILLQIGRDEPPQPRKLNSKIPRDLETITLKCLQKEPSKRYQKAAELADDLRHWLRSEPIKARPVGKLARSWRWIKRNKTVAGLTAIVIVTILVGTLSTAFYAIVASNSSHSEARARRLAERKAIEAQEASVEANQQRELVERLLYSARVKYARELLRTKPDLAQAALDQCPPALRGWEFGYVQEPLRSMHFTTVDVDSQVHRFAGQVTVSPDGTYVVSTHSDKRRVRVWDSKTGREVLVLEGLKALPRAIAVRSDNKQIAALHSETITLWDLEKPQDPSLLTWIELEGRTRLSTRETAELALSRTIAYSPDGSRLAVGEGGGWVKIWNSATGERQFRFWHRNGPDAEGPKKSIPMTVMSIAFSPDNRVIATAVRSGQITLWNGDTGDEIGKLDGNGSHLIFSPNGRHLACVLSGSDVVALWEVESPRRPRLLAGHNGAINALVFSPNSRRLVTSGSDKSIKLWDVDSGQEIATYFGHRAPVTCLAFHRDGPRLASVSADWKIGQWKLPPAIDGMQLSSAVARIAFSKDGRQIACDTKDKKVVVIDVDTAAEHFSTLKRSKGFVGAAFSSDGKSLVTAGSNGTIDLWDVRNRQEPRTIGKHAGDVTDVAVTHDNRWIMSASSDKTIKLWDAQSGDEIRTFQGAPTAFTRVICNQQSDRIAGVSADRSVWVWNLNTEETPISFEVSPSAITSLAFSPDGRRLTTASEDASITIWDISTSRPVAVLRGHTAAVRSISYSADGRRLASGGDDGLIKLWDADSGLEVFSLDVVPGNAVTSVAFSPDTSRLICGCANGTIRAWDAASVYEKRSADEATASGS